MKQANVEHRGGAGRQEERTGRAGERPERTARRIAGGVAAALGLIGVLGSAAGCGQTGESSPASEAAPQHEATGEAQQAASTPTLCVKLPASDTHISAEKTTTNYGTSSFALSGASTTGVPSQFASMFQFNTQSIPADATVVSATVTLSQTNTGAATSKVHLVNVGWSANTVTWASLGGAYTAQAFTTFGLGAATVSFNVAPQAQGWVALPGSNHGVLIEQNGSTFQTKFKSNEYPVTTQRPALDLCYKVVCAPGYADCNNNAADGCEADLSYSATSCGACGVVCPPLPHATAGCNAGACTAAFCDEGWGDCDNNPANGCEASLAISTANPNCGACGTSCPPCGGSPVTLCPFRLDCVDDPNDGCDPHNGGVNCPGICVGPQTCLGIGGFGCASGSSCVDDPGDSCDLFSGGSDCGGLCLSDDFPQSLCGFFGPSCPSGYHCQDIPGDDCTFGSPFACMGGCYPDVVPEQCPYFCNGFGGFSCPAGLICDEIPLSPGEDAASTCIPSVPCTGIGNFTCPLFSEFCADDPTDNCDSNVDPTCPGRCISFFGAGPTFCGGVMGLGCGAGQSCHDIPCDGCNPATGGVNCLGACSSP